MKICWSTFIFPLTTIILGLILVACDPSEVVEYPEREVTIIDNYGPGGSTDLSLRILAEAAEPGFGQPFRVVNKAGGSGTVGPMFVKQSKPDGYTIGVASLSPMAVVPHMQAVPYSLDDFDFILAFARYRFGIAVPRNSPFRTIEDMIEAAKSGVSLTYASTGALAATLAHRVGHETGTKFKWVRYKSGQEAATAVLGGFVDFVIENPASIVPHVKSGTMRLLASAGSIRWSELPDVPTLTERGYNVTVESYIGLAAAAGTPLDVLSKLESTFAKAMQSRQVQKRLLDLGMEPDYLTSIEYRKLLEDTYQMMGVELAEIGLAR